MSIITMTFTLSISCGWVLLSFTVYAMTQVCGACVTGLAYERHDQYPYYRSGRIITIETTDDYDCGSRCLGTCNCVGFYITLVSGKIRCELKSSLGSDPWEQPLNVTRDYYERKQEACVTGKAFNRFDNTDSSGDDIFILENMDEKECWRRCTATCNCVGFVLVPKANGNPTCYLKASLSSIGPAQGITMYECSTGTCVTDAGFAYNKFDNTDSIGNDIFSFENMDVVECSRLCSATCKCVGFVIVPISVGKNICYLKSSLYWRGPAQGKTMYERTKGPVGYIGIPNMKSSLGYIEYYDKDITPGKDISAVVTSNIDSCGQQCLSTQGCAAFVFDRNWGKCFFKESVSLIQAAGKVSFIRRYHVYPAVDIAPGNDISSRDAQHPSDCALDCEALQGCTAFVFVAKWNNVANWNKCFFKATVELVISDRDTRTSFVKIPSATMDSKLYAGSPQDFRYCWPDRNWEQSGQCFIPCPFGWRADALSCYQGLAIKVGYRGSATNPHNLRRQSFIQPKNIPGNYLGTADFTYIIASDIQYPWCDSYSTTGFRGYGGFEQCALATVVNHVKAMNRVGQMKWPNSQDQVQMPEAVIINGDLTAYWNNGNYEGIYKQVDIYRAFFDQNYPFTGFPHEDWPGPWKERLNKDYKIFIGLGNHDYENNVENCFGEGSVGLYKNFCTEQAVNYLTSGVMNGFIGGFDDHSLSSFHKESLAYSWDRGNYHFIILHNYPTYEMRQHKDLASSSLPWLKVDTSWAAAAGKRIVIFIHDVDDKFKMREHVGFIDAINFARHSITAIFCGHIHLSFGKLDDFIIGSTHIPVFRSGAAESSTFLISRFGAKSMTVAVVDSTDGYVPKIVGGPWTIAV